MGVATITTVPAVGSQVTRELAAAGVPTRCPQRGRSIEIHTEGACPDCGRPWPEHHEAA